MKENDGERREQIDEKEASRNRAQIDLAWEHLKQLSVELSAHWPAGISAADAINDLRSEGQAKSNLSHEHELKDFWERIDKLAAQIGEYIPTKIDAVQIVREGDAIYKDRQLYPESG